MPCDSAVSRLLHADDERGAAVQPAGLLARVVVLRPLLAVATRLEAVRRRRRATSGSRARCSRVGRPARGCIPPCRCCRCGPSMTMFRAGVRLQLRDRVVEQPQRLRPQRRAVEVEVHVFERQLAPAPGGRPECVTVAGAVPPLPSLTVTVTCTGPSCCGAVQTVWRSAGFASVPAAPSSGRSACRRPDPARRRHRRRASDFHRARIARAPAPSAAGSAAAGGGGGRRRRRWRRRHVTRTPGWKPIRTWQSTKSPELVGSLSVRKSSRLFSRQRSS